MPPLHNTTASGVVLTWNPPASSLIPVASYHVYRANITDTQWTLDQNVTGTTATITNSAQIFTVTSVGFNGVESDFCNIATNPVPNAPTNLN